MREGLIAVAAALLAFAAAPAATAAVIDAGAVEAAEVVQGSSAAGSGGGVIAGNAGGYLSCPPGKRALTGGAFWAGAGQPPSVTSSTVTADGKGWYAAGNDLSSAGELTTRVRCLPKGRLRKARTVTRTCDEPGTDFAAGRASCPRRTGLITGGAFFHPAGEGPDPQWAVNVALGASLPTPGSRGWYAAGIAFSETPKLTVVARCLAKRRLAKIKVTERTVALPSGAGEVGGNVSCPGERRALTGGAYIHAPGEAHGAGNWAGIARLGGSTFVDGVAGTAWHAGGSRSATGQVPPLDLTFTAHCLNGKDPRDAEVVRGSVPLGEQAEIDRVCKKVNDYLVENQFPERLDCAQIPSLKRACEAINHFFSDSGIGAYYDCRTGKISSVGDAARRKLRELRKRIGEASLPGRVDRGLQVRLTRIQQAVSDANLATACTRLADVLDYIARERARDRIPSGKGRRYSAAVREVRDILDCAQVQAP